MSELEGAVVVETSQLTLQLRTAAGLVVERLENTATGVMLGGARQPLFTIVVTWSAAGVRHVASTDLVVAQVTVPDHHHVHIVGTMLDSAFQVGVSLTVDAYGVLRGQVTLTTQEAGWQLVSIDWLPLPANPAAPTVWQHPDYDYPLTPYNATPQQIMLGQPVYVDSFFMGCEFPATDNRIADGLVLIRYFRFGICARHSVFVPTFVLGPAAASNLAAVRTAFFQYIDRIAQPLQFRLQYNSWYDHRMAITEKSVTAAFTEFHRQAVAHDLPPIDAYVLDDGWNNYNNAEFGLHDEERSGKTDNRTGFWEVNDKFDFDLTNLANLTKQLGSKFGLWFGPQGGYEINAPFARYLAAHGTGSVDPTMALGEVIDTADAHYIQLTEDLLCQFQRDYDIDYSKFDGFASRSSQQAGNRHLVGGPDNMYFLSEYWHRWLGVFAVLRAERAAVGKGLFINATSYVPLSPWMLQWVNSVWLQNAGDDPQQGVGDPADVRMTGRDQQYFNLFVQADLQFPLARLYNHEPIYGVSAENIQMTNAESRKYLYWNVFRGQQFMELYFSPTMLDREKWDITKAALQFAKAHRDVLQHARYVGGAPEEGVYGFLSWDGEKGFLSVRNGSRRVQEVDLQQLTGLRDVTFSAFGKDVDDSLDVLASAEIKWVTINQPRVSL